MIKDLLGFVNFLGVVALLIFGLKSVFIIERNWHWYDWKGDFFGLVFLSDKTIRRTTILSVALFLSHQLYTLL